MVDIFAIFIRETAFVISCLAILHTKPIRKRGLLRKEDLFSKRDKAILT